MDQPLSLLCDEHRNEGRKPDTGNYTKE